MEGLEVWDPPRAGAEEVLVRQGGTGSVWKDLQHLGWS